MAQPTTRTLRIAPAVRIVSSLSALRFLLLPLKPAALAIHLGDNRSLVVRGARTILLERLP